MITRRSALGASLALASVACGSSAAAYSAITGGRRRARTVDAFLVDRTIALPGRMTAFVAASEQTFPIIGIDLDAAAHAGLMRVLADSDSLVGISSGATLFCVERLAWDHGFRLVQRTARPLADARWQEPAALLRGHDLAATPLAPVRGYAPSRADGVLHSWLMQKADTTRSRGDAGARS